MAKTYFLHQDIDNGYVNKNVYYLLGFNPSLGTVIFDDENIYLIFDARYYGKIQKIPKARFKKFFGNKMKIKNILLDIDLEIKIDSLLRGKDLVIEENLPLYMYKKLKEIKPKDLEITYNIFNEKRIIKSTEELNKIKKAISIVNKVYKELFDARETLIGIKEIEVRKIINRSILRNGGDDESFPSIVAFGKNSAIPHHESGNTVIGNGPLLIDMGVVYQGYCSDFTRTFWIGEKNEQFDDFNKILKIVKNAHLLGKNFVKEGITGKELDKCVRDYIKSFGYGKYFTHTTGHGIGLQNHEEPWISERKGDLKLKKGMLFTIEPGIYLPGKFGVRWENIIIM
ncbi:M24 family metallopeptidase [Candidatus Gracilibacteria bacterium]|nr:M24 family metallopeptidase [Candidatus Gracilibacteria bacterium]